MSKYDTGAFLQAYARHAYRYGHPKTMYVDAGSQILKACRDMQISWTDITNTLNADHDVGIEHIVAPVLGHNQIGMVERSVLEVKKLFDLTFTGLRLDSLSFETAFQFIANELNSLPLCLGSRTSNLDHTDLITPSRLILGRNNRRSPSGYPRVSSKSRQVEDLDTVYRAWWKVWKLERLVDYIPRPNKWLKTTREPKVDDIIVFLKVDKEVALGQSLWRLGRIKKIVISADSRVRQATIEYKNHNESKSRETCRPVRKIAIIHREGDLELVQELNRAAKEATVGFQMRILANWKCKSTYCSENCLDAANHTPDTKLLEY
jgi:hypothetical protein